MEDSNIYISLPDSATEHLADPALSMFWSNYSNRTFWIDDEISMATMDLVDYIIQCNREDKGKSIEQRIPIRILIASPGGSLDVADSLIDIISASQTPIYGYAMGMVASAASAVYLACHKRYALKSSYFILHKGSANMSGNYNEMMQAVEDYQKQVERMVKFYIERTKISEEVVRDKIKTDWYLHSDEAIESGIVDEILTNLDEVI